MRPMLLLLALLMGCDPWPEVEKANTIEAYEKYLAENPSSMKSIEARARLEQLYLTAARDAQSLELYDAYLKRFPKGDLAADAVKERDAVFWTWCETTDTPEAWQRYIDENAKADKLKIKKARGRLRMSQHKSAVGLSEPVVKKVNLAEDPKGELNGWGFYTDVTNTGDQPIEYLALQVRYLDANGKTVGAKEWPAVAKALPGNVPFAAGFDKPIEPGGKRTWEWTAGFEELPKEWAEKVSIVPVNIRIVGETEAPGADREVDLNQK